MIYCKTLDLFQKLMLNIFNRFPYSLSSDLLKNNKRWFPISANNIFVKVISLPNF